MTIRKINPDNWQKYFDQLSRWLPSSDVDIVVSGLDLGVQVQAQRSHLLGISYDREDRALHIAMEHLNHRISDPEDIYVEEEGGAVRAIEAVDRSGNKQILELTNAVRVA